MAIDMRSTRIHLMLSSLAVFACSPQSGARLEESPVGSHSASLTFYEPEPLFDSFDPSYPQLEGWRLRSPDPECNYFRLATDRQHFLEMTYYEIGFTGQQFNDLIDLSAHAAGVICNEGVTREVYDVWFEIAEIFNVVEAQVAADEELSLEEAAALIRAKITWDAKMFEDVCGGGEALATDFLSGATQSYSAAKPFGDSCSLSERGSTEGTWGGQVGGGIDCIRGVLASAQGECSPDAGDGDDEEQPEPEDGDEAPEPTPEEEQTYEEVMAERGEDIKEVGETIAYSGAALGLICPPCGVTVAGAGGVIWLFGKLHEVVPGTQGANESLDCGIGFPGSNGSSLTYVDPATGGEMDLADAMMGCFCAGAERDYGHAWMFPGSCSPDSKTRRECLVHPFGPDDGIRFECWGLLEEDNEPWETDSNLDPICMVLQCPVGMESRSIGDESCRCESVDSSPGSGSGDCSAYLCPSGDASTGVPGLCLCNSFLDGAGNLVDGFAFELAYEGAGQFAPLPRTHGVPWPLSF